ncbi:hypothetical protein ERJ75_001791500 [Trypanosoma vivax]|nr:hypothetical protein ERJ75_001791500 [Trypanosoma vivax]
MDPCAFLQGGSTATPRLEHKRGGWYERKPRGCQCWRPAKASRVSPQIHAPPLLCRVLCGCRGPVAASAVVRASLRRSFGWRFARIPDARFVSLPLAACRGRHHPATSVVAHAVLPTAFRWATPVSASRRASPHVDTPVHATPVRSACRVPRRRHVATSSAQHGPALPHRTTHSVRCLGPGALLDRRPVRAPPARLRCHGHQPTGPD